MEAKPPIWKWWFALDSVTKIMAVSLEAKYRKVTGFFTLEGDLNLKDFRMISV